MTGPTHHLLIEHERLNREIEQAQLCVRGPINEAVSDIDMRIARSVTEAYRRGVIDGFQQGCLASAADA